MIRPCVMGTVAAWLVGCGRVGFDDADGRGDARNADAAATTCSVWSTPTPVPGLDAIVPAEGPSLTADQRLVYFDSADGVFVASRAAIDQPFSLPVRVTFDGIPSVGGDADVRGDGAELFLSRPAGEEQRVVITTRIGGPSQFGPVTALDELGFAINPAIANAGDVLRYDFIPGAGMSAVPYRARRDPLGGPWQVLSALAELSPATALTVSGDERTVVFERLDGADFHLYMATRTAPDRPFDPPMLIAELATVPGAEPWISPDGTRLYFARPEPGGATLWQTLRTCG